MIVQRGFYECEFLITISKHALPFHSRVMAFVICLLICLLFHNARFAVGAVELPRCTDGMARL